MKRITKEQIQEIHRLYKAGKSFGEIQKIVGVSSRSVVHYHVKRLGSVREAYVSKKEYNDLLRKYYTVSRERDNIVMRLQRIYDIAGIALEKETFENEVLENGIIF